MTTSVACAACLAVVPATEQDDAPPTGPLAAALAPWLVTRRWFAHELGCLSDLRLRTVSVLRAGPPALLHVLADAHHSGHDRPHRYQLLLGLCRTVPGGLGDAVVGRIAAGPWKDWWLYEATADPALMSALLQAAADPAAPGAPRLSARQGLTLPAGPARALSVDQSNTTVVYGDRLLLKLLRSPEPGPHPEVETLAALTEAGSERTPALRGRLHCAVPGEPDTVLGVLSEYVASAGDGWQLATRQAAECVTGSCRGVPAVGGFTGEAHALGRAVAEVHRALARSFPVVRLSPGQVAAEVAAMTDELACAVREVPQLERFAGRISTLYHDYARVAVRSRGVPAQRTHGDLHLGQVLRAEDGWTIIDFEGEPDRPTADRTRPRPVLRDIAGMLRSFDYAAQYALAELTGEPVPAPGASGAAGRLRQTRRAYAWAVRNRRAFIAGYASAGGTDPRCHPVILRALEAEKAVYEARYEARHRPDRLPIPLAAAQRLAATR